MGMGSVGASPAAAADDAFTTHLAAAVGGPEARLHLLRRYPPSTTTSRCGVHGHPPSGDMASSKDKMMPARTTAKEEEVDELLAAHKLEQLEMAMGMGGVGAPDPLPRTTPSPPTAPAGPESRLHLLHRHDRRRFL